MAQAYASAELRRLVRERANNCCEYCWVNERFSFFPHELDHIFAQQHGGETVEFNLALSCSICNKHKGPNLTSLDPVTGNIEPLFHPRRHKWRDHFQLVNGQIDPLTPTGRATVNLLRLNSNERIVERHLLIESGSYAAPQ
jgi:hypothetical protein